MTAELVSLAPARPLPGPSLAEIRQDADALHESLVVEVRRLRLQGASWAQIGRGLGVSRQSAWERWKYLDDSDVALVRLPDGRVIVRDDAGVEADLEEPTPAELEASMRRVVELYAAVEA